MADESLMARYRLSDQRGFSMIELTVVLLIIAILVGITIPTFLGMKERFQDTAAKESAVLAVKAALPLASGTGEMFEGVATAALNKAEPSLTFVDGSQPSTSFTVVSQTVAVGDTVFVAAVRSSSGTCFMIRHQSSGSDFVSFPGGSCQADELDAVVFGPSW